MLTVFCQIPASIPSAFTSESTPIQNDGSVRPSTTDRKLANRFGDVVTKKFFAYARVSSQEQADRDLSIPAQLRAIRTFAAEQGLEIVQEFVDMQSAKGPGRTNFTAMLTQLKRRPDIAGVLSHKLDRFLRNLRDYAEVDDLMQTGKEFRFVAESYDHSPSGKLVLGVRAVFAKFYLDTSRKRQRKVSTNEYCSAASGRSSHRSATSTVTARSFQIRRELRSSRKPSSCMRQETGASMSLLTSSTCKACEPGRSDVARLVDSWRAGSTRCYGIPSTAASWSIRAMSSAASTNR